MLAQMNPKIEGMLSLSEYAENSLGSKNVNLGFIAAPRFLDEGSSSSSAPVKMQMDEKKTGQKLTDQDVNKMLKEIAGIKDPAKHDTGHGSKAGRRKGESPTVKQPPTSWDGYKHLKQARKLNKKAMQKFSSHFMGDMLSILNDIDEKGIDKVKEERLDEDDEDAPRRAAEMKKFLSKMFDTLGEDKWQDILMQTEL